MILDTTFEDELRDLWLRDKFLTFSCIFCEQYTGLGQNIIERIFKSDEYSDSDRYQDMFCFNFIFLETKLVCICMDVFYIL